MRSVVGSERAEGGVKGVVSGPPANRGPKSGERIMVAVSMSRGSRVKL